MRGNVVRDSFDTVVSDIWCQTMVYSNLEAIVGLLFIDDAAAVNTTFESFLGRQSPATSIQSAPELPIFRQLIHLISKLTLSPPPAEPPRICPYLR